MTVFTVVYNGYGKFIPKWLDYINKQTEKPNVIIVLGENHEADIDFLKENKIEYIIYQSENMGKLRNKALEKIKGWWLYFSVDDELLPHACEEITKTNSDLVSLYFDAIQPNGEMLKKRRSPLISSVKDLLYWDNNTWGGYVACRNNDIRFREDVLVPNYMFHFDAFKMGLKSVRSQSVCAIHHRWEKSHHYISSQDGSRKKMVDLIKKEAERIFTDYLKKENKVKIKVLKSFEDINTKQKYKKNEIIEIPFNENRIKKIIKEKHGEVL